MLLQYGSERGAGILRVEVYVAGGKRAAKSEWAAKRFVESCVTYGDSLRWAFQDNERTSIATQQKLIWKYLPPELKALNQLGVTRGTLQML